MEDSLFERENASAIYYLLQTVAKSLKTSFFLSLWTKEVLKSHKFSLYFLRNMPFSQVYTTKILIDIVYKKLNRTLDLATE